MRQLFIPIGYTAHLNPATYGRKSIPFHPAP